MEAKRPRDGSERVQQIFADALERPPEERAAFLERACRSDPELRAQVERRLREQDEGSIETLPISGPRAGTADDTQPKPFEPAFDARRHS